MKSPDGSSEGVLFIATGDRHRCEACAAVKHCRPHLEGRPVALVTDAPASIPHGLFEQVLPHPEPRYSYRDKIEPLIMPPFKRTLYLDTDAELIQPVCDLFAMLKSLELLACHAPVRFHGWKDPAIPDGFCEVNSGVIGLQRCNKTASLMRHWLATYDRIGIQEDQASLRSSLWACLEQGLKFYVLPTEYNIRTTKPWTLGRGIRARVVHGRLRPRQRRQLLAYLEGAELQFKRSGVVSTNANEWCSGEWPLRRRILVLRSWIMRWTQQLISAKTL